MDEIIAGQWYQFASQLQILAKGAVLFYAGLFLLIALVVGIMSLVEMKKE